MTLAHIAVFSLAALIYGWFLPAHWRGWALMAGSVVAIYWLQPALPIRQIDFVLPTATLSITVACWFIVRAAEPLTGDDYRTLIVTTGLILGLSATRYLVPELRLTSRPPETIAVAIALVLTAGIVLALWRIGRTWSQLYSASILGLVGLFIVFKFEPLTVWFSGLLRAWQGQDVALASPIDLGWLGLSYVAFRLMHTLRDKQTGQLPALNLREYLTYVIFFPAYTAGPIDRAERFVEDYRNLCAGLPMQRLMEGASRIVTGLFKKFVLADSLALIALDLTSAQQATSPGGLWLLLYAYAFRLYLDFSGYTDIAIGLGILYGIRLPENFTSPYTKNSITAFWQSWHITLSNWVRFYVFTPVSRALLRRPRKPSTLVILLFCHLLTMIVIGLWHGIAWTFLIWGVWHGLGLYIHKLWSDRTRKWYRGLKQRPLALRLWHVVGTILTFHFVLLGWVWFALPNLDIALAAFLKLFGAAS